MGFGVNGCEWVFERYRFGKLPSHVVSDLVPPGIDPFWVLRARQDRVMSKAGFSRHVQHYCGVGELIVKLDRQS